MEFYISAGLFKEQNRREMYYCAKIPFSFFFPCPVQERGHRADEEQLGQNALSSFTSATLARLLDMEMNNLAENSLLTHPHMPIQCTQHQGDT